MQFEVGTFMEETEVTGLLPWNVISEDNYRQRARDVFEQVAEMLKNTLGPYGSTTIIEQFGEMYITKDGWNILQKIHFDDPTDNNILQLLRNISAQVVVKVGDGSTSSIVAANQILKQLESNDELKKIRPKELLDVLSKCADKISESIQAQAFKIDVESDPEFTQIYKLAMISTNGNEQVSRMIQTIYKETSNPFIEYLNSKTNRTHHEIVEGYQILGKYLDTLYVNTDDGTCEIDNPIIIMFDHVVQRDLHLSKIIGPLEMTCAEMGRRLVVIAPHYDKAVMDHLRIFANAEAKQTGTTRTVFALAQLPTGMHQELYSDFAVMTGGTIIAENHIPGILEEVNNIQDLIGTVERISIGKQDTIISGFGNRNENMYNITVHNAVAKYKEVAQTHSELNIVNSELYELKKRVSKLRSKMGRIYVGGNSGLDKKANKDLVDDAVKACESAFNYGYNIGGNLIIPIAINAIEPATREEEIIFGLLGDAFRNVFTKVLLNKYKEVAEPAEPKKKSLFRRIFEMEEFTKAPVDIDEILDECIYSQRCYDLVKDEYSTDVINPSHTDIEILKAATSIVALLLSSNQYISIKYGRDGQ